MNTPIISIRKDYSAPQIDWKKVAALLAVEVQPFLGNETTFSGTQKWKDEVTVQKEFESMEEWSKLPQFPIESIRGTISTRGYERYFEIHFRPERGELTLSAAVFEAEKTEAVALIRKLERELALHERDETQPSIRVDTRYALTTKEDHEWLKKVLEKIGTLFPHFPQRHGELRLTSGATRKFEQIDVLTKNVAEERNAVDSVSMYFYFPANTIWVRWNPAREEFDVEVSSPTEAQAVALTGKVAEMIGLQRLDREGGREGITRFGFVQGKFDPAWFTNAVAQVSKLFPRMLYSRFEITRVGEGQGPGRVNTIENWSKEVVQKWPEVWNSFALIESGQRVVRLTIWQREHSVRLEVESPRRADAEAVLNELATAMEINFTDENSYRKDKSSCAYGINVWQDTVFAELVRDTIPVSMGEDHWIVEAWIKEKGEQGQPFHHAKSLDEYLKLLGGKTRFTETDLRVHGPRGRALRIHVYDNRSRLDFSSSLEQEDLDDIAETFRIRLKLKPPTEVEAVPPSQSEESKPKSLWMRALPAIGASVLTFIFSTAVFTAIFPQYRINVVTPLGGKDAPKELPTSECRVVWRVQKEHLFQKNDLNGIRANISLLEGQKVIDYPDKASGELALTLPPGSYTLLLDFPAAKASETIHFTVKSTNSAPSPVPAPTK